MKNKIMSLIVVSLLPMSTVSAEEAASDWTFSGNLVYSSRPYAGSFTKKQTTDVANGGMFATDETMNLDTSDTMMLALGVRYKRYGAIINYMPTNYYGQGTALIGSNDVGDVGKFKESPLDTTIEVDMLLANVYYNLIQTRSSVFGLGVGFGQTSINIDLTPELRSEELGVNYSGTQPFGFLSMHMSNTHGKFLYGFVVHGIQAEFNNVEVKYSDYKIDLGYRLVDKRYKFDIVGGYRSVNFDADINTSSGEVVSKMTLEGPFFGVNVAY